MNALKTKELLAASAFAAFGLWLSGSFNFSYASPAADTVELAQAAPDKGTAAGPSEEGQDGGQRAIEQQQQEEAERAERKQQQEAERAAREQQKQQEEAERAERKQQQEAERAAREQRRQQEEAERAARKQQDDAERAQREQQQEAERAAREQQKEAERAERKQQQEAERAAREQQKQQEEAERAARKQQDEAERTQREQQQEAERATREQARQQKEAERAERKQQQDAERAAREQQSQQEEAGRAAKKRPEDADKAETKAEEQDEDEKAKADAERVRQEADKAQLEAETKQRDAAKKANEGAGQEPDGGATKPNGEQAQPVQPETERSRADFKVQDGRPRLRERRFEPKDEKQAVEQIKEERAKADAEFERAKREAAQSPELAAVKGGELRSQEFERIRKQRRERVEDGGQRAVIEEPDDRRIVLEKDRAFVRHDEDRRFARLGKRIKHERRKDGTTLSIYLSLGGVEIITVEDEYGRLLRRSRRNRDGREIVLVDNRRFYESRPRRGYGEVFVTLPPPKVRIPHSRYILDYDEASEDDLYEALMAPPVERLDRRYSLDEVRYGYGLRERMRRVDLDAINFAFGSWEVEESQYAKLERMARVIKRILRRNPDEMFLIEGHTDAVGSNIDNLSLSDRRAESVAIILSDSFRVPPENLTTQGYGEQYLKVPTSGPSRENRRVAVRRITPLLSQADLD